jgi:hypothetical protein
MASFFEAERNQAGWRFGLLWIVMTLIGFGVGLGIEWLLFPNVNLYFAVPIAGVAQGWVLNRHISIYIPWAGSTAIAWWIGAFVTRTIVSAILIEPNLILELGIVTVVAGLLAGILQWFFIREWLPSVGIWWLVIGAISWQLPGIISALVLTPFVTHDKVDLEGKRFILTGRTIKTGDLSQISSKVP